MNTLSLKHNDQQFLLKGIHGDRFNPALILHIQLKSIARKNTPIFLVLLKNATSTDSQVSDPDIEVLLHEFSDVFPEKLPDRLPPQHDVYHHFDLEPVIKYIFQHPYRLAPKKMDELKAQLTKLIDTGFI